MEANGNYLIINTHECRNTARNKRFGGEFAKKEFRKFTKLSKKLSRTKLFLGVYHSHPISASIRLGEQDKYSGNLFRLFRMQLILGLKNRGVVKHGFWKVGKNKKWASFAIKEI
jgi:hypothetical protein